MAFCPSSFSSLLSLKGSAELGRFVAKQAGLESSAGLTGKQAGLKGPAVLAWDQSGLKSFAAEQAAGLPVVLLGPGPALSMTFQVAFCLSSLWTLLRL